MGLIDRLITDLAYASSAAIALLVVRLVSGGLWRAYPWFFGYLVVLGSENALLEAAHGGPLRTLQMVWVVTRLLATLLEVKLVLSLFAAWTVSFPGIGAFGRRLLVVILIATVAIAASTLSIGTTTPEAWWSAMRIAAIVSRAANIAFALFLLLTLSFFRKFGGPVAPNLKRITAGMAVYTGANSLSYLALTSSAIWLGNILLPLVTLAAAAFWLVSLNAEGELQPLTTGDEAQWREAEQMNRQMQKLADAVTLTPRGVKRQR